MGTDILSVPRRMETLIGPDDEREERMSGQPLMRGEDPQGSAGAPQSSGRVAFTLVACLTTLLCWAAVVGMLVLALPRFKEVFEDFGAELPLVTIWALSLSDLLLQYGRFVAAPFTLLAVGSTIGEIEWRKAESGRVRWPILSTLLPLGVGIILVLSALPALLKLLNELR